MSAGCFRAGAESGQVVVTMEEYDDCRAQPGQSRIGPVSITNLIENLMISGPCR